MRGVRAAVLMALRMRMCLCDRDSGPRRFAHIQRGAITAEHFHRRPIRQYRNCGGRVGAEFPGGMNDGSTNNGEHGFDALDLLFGDGEVIVRESDKVSQLTRSKRAFLAALAGKPTAALGVESQRLLAA